MKKLLNITQCQIQKSILLGAAKCIIYCLSQIILILFIAQTNSVVLFFLELKMHLGSVFIFSVLIFTIYYLIFLY